LGWAGALVVLALAHAPEAAAQPGTASRVLVLSPADEAAYAEAFASVAAQEWPLVELALRRVQDQSLVGAVRARMLREPAYPAQASHIEAWFARYGDQPAAADLAARARTLGVKTAPARTQRRAYPHAAPRPPGDTPAAQDQIERIVQAFAANDWSEARSLAQAALAGPRLGEAAHWLGLLAWREAAFAEAANHFAAAAAWPHQGPWERARAHAWAARAWLAAGRAREAPPHLRQAAKAPHTLYGQLAEAQLGRSSSLQFALAPTPAPELAEFAQRHPGARRAAAFAQLGRLSDAERELEQLHAQLPAAQDRLLLALAEALVAPRAQLRVAEYGAPDVAAGHCPTHSFAPLEGVALDPAALAAVMRQESRFTPVAVSRSRAQGLMQLLPSTAQDLAPGANFRAEPERLHDPALNVSLGDRYLVWLLERPSVQGDLLRAVAAYNGGPGWLQRWLAGFSAAADPWLVLEALPRAETRTYAARVLSFYALCRHKAGETAPELDALASGRAPLLDRAAR
jgi:soluble lytic murein transglycosylase-like protein